jgi:hypothetical protein
MRLALSSIVILAAAGGAFAQQQPDRYRLEKSGEDFVRMDTRTGEMSVCRQQSGQLVCRLAADERSAFQADIDRLAGQVAALETRVGSLEGSLAQRLERSLPTEEEFSKSRSYMERFLRGFMGNVKDIEDDRPAGDGQKT